MIKFNFETNYEFDFDAKKLIKRILRVINKTEKIKNKHVLSVVIINNEEIQKINREYRKIDSPTDVISFALIDEVKDSKVPFELGDIFISYEKVIEQAKTYEHSLIREFAFLVTHGVFHLLGYDHIDKTDEVIMFEKQEYVLSILKINR